jgi:hypothetical protein
VLLLPLLLETPLLDEGGSSVVVAGAWAVL